MTVLCNEVASCTLNLVFEFAPWSDCSISIWEDFFSGSFLLLSLSEAIKAAGSTFTQQKTRQIFRPIFCLVDKASNKPLMTDPAIICQSDPQCYNYDFTVILADLGVRMDKIYSNTLTLISALLVQGNMSVLKTLFTL